MSLKTLKKGDKVILHLFTGIGIAQKEITEANKKTITVETAKGDIVFDRVSGRQISPKPKKERFANFITPDTGDFTPPRKKKSVNKTDSTKKVKKVITKKRAFNEDEYGDGN